MIANRYSLEREIGRGGMGSVWLGRDEVLDRPVAMKRVGRLPGTAEDREADQMRAEREARIAASLNHPHVVAIFDLVADEDHQWLVMEFVDGRSLSQVVRDQGPLSVDQAAAVLADAAAALATAHAEGVVHRDVKPSNILLTVAGEAKLLDFGIAKAQGDLTLTQTGLVSGSPAYLSPEVASGRPATTASDVWSLGATLFHLLTGKPPYDIGDNVVGGLYRIVHQEPPTVDDPGWLAPLLAATMVRDPDQRWSMHRVAAFLEGGPEGARAAGLSSVDQPTRAMRAVPPAAAVSGDGGDPPTTQQPAQRAAASAPPPTRSAQPPPASPGRRSRTGPGRSRRGVWVLLAVVVGLLGAIVIALLLPDDQSGPPEQDVTASPVDPSEDSSEPSPSPGEGPTKAGMAAFVNDYLTTATTDNRAGFEMLTAGFQAESGGFSGYQRFWGQVREIIEVEVDQTNVNDQRVRYTYTYRLSDGNVNTETVSLRLDYDEADDRYLIAGEA